MGGREHLGHSRSPERGGSPRSGGEGSWPPARSASPIDRPLAGGGGASSIGSALRTRLAGFVRTLRDNGFAVGLAETEDALRLLASPAAVRPATLRPALKTLFSASRSDFERFDAIFDAYWSGRGVRSVQRSSGAARTARKLGPQLAGMRSGERPGVPDRTERRPWDGGADGAGKGRKGGATSAEALMSTDIRHIADPEETAKVHALAERLARRMRARLVRRAETRRRGRRLDLRRTIHKSIARGGTPVDLAFRRRKEKPLRLVVLLDASGSMSLYTAFFVRFLHGVVDAFREAEAFLFHTRLVHVSPSLRDRNVGRAVDRLSLAAEGIGGGTRIGESLAAFNRWHARRVVNARTAVVIVSDGYDTGPADRLAAEMRRLRRRARRIVWLNPLLGWRDYAPEAGGMKAALPFVDLFAPAHNLESLAALEPHLARI